MEAAVYGIPVLFGPKYQKFREAHELIACGGGFSVHDESEFVTHMNDFITHPEKRKQIGCVVSNYVQQNSGVAERILKEMIIVR